MVELEVANALKIILEMPRFSAKMCAAVEPCGLYSSCIEKETEDAVCSCWPGYKQDKHHKCHECLLNDDCGINAFCQPQNYYGNRKCRCFTHFKGNPRSYCKQTCLELKHCGANSVCVEGLDDRSDATCKCLPGYIEDDFNNCHECLQNINCGTNAHCVRSQNGLNMCKCPNHFMGNPTVYCKKTCASIRHCGLNQICTEGFGEKDDAYCRCASGDKGDENYICHGCLKHSDCGKNAGCFTSYPQGVRYCQCKKNYDGDPKIYCKKTCAAKGICPFSRSCIEGLGPLDDALCKCAEGYKEEDGTCHGCLKHSDCGENARCYASYPQKERFCLCNNDYDGNPQIYCKKTCAAIGFCPPNRTCIEGLVPFDDAVCKCSTGYKEEAGSCHAICDIPCGNGGTCIGPNLCSCMVEFSGSHCQYRCPGKRPVYTQRHRQFYSSYNKHDKHRHMYYKCYNGKWILALGEEENCEKCIHPVTVCDPHCLNGGICLESGKCKCRHEYTGPQCQYSICTPPCVNGGTCVGSNNCKCINGYTGHRCKIPVCYPKCENGGMCAGPSNCLCTKSFVGDHCQFQAGKFSFVDNDPHFVVRVPNFQQAVCFDVHGNDGDILNLIQDQISGTLVNGLIRKVQSLPTSTHLVTLSLMLPSVNLTMTTRSINVDYWRREKQKKKRNLRNINSRSCTSNYESAEDKMQCRDILLWKKMRRLRYGKSTLHLKKKQVLHIGMKNMRESIVVQRQSSKKEWYIGLHSDSDNKVLEGKEVIGVILGETIKKDLSNLGQYFYVNLFLTIGVINIIVTAENIVIYHSELDDSKVSWNNQKIYKYKNSGTKEHNMISSNCTNTKYFTGKNLIKCWETYPWKKKLSLRFGSTTVVIKRNHKIYITEETNRIIMTLSKSVSDHKNWGIHMQKYDDIKILKKKNIVDVSVRALTTKDVQQTRSSYFTQLFLVLPDFNLTIATNTISLKRTTDYKKQTYHRNSFPQRICSNHALLNRNTSGKDFCTDKFSWRKAFTHKYGNTKISVKKRRRLHIYINNGEAHFVVTRTRNKARQWFLGFYVQEQHFLSKFSKGIIGEFLSKVIASLSTNITDTSSMTSEYSVQLSLFKRSKHRRYKLSDVNTYDRVSDIEAINEKRRSLLKKIHVDCLFVQNHKSILNEDFQSYKRQCLTC